MCQEHFEPEGAYLLGTCGHPWHLACLAKFSLASRSCYCKAPIQRRFYLSIGREAFMPPGMAYMISRPDIRSSMVILLNRYYRSSVHCLRGMRPWFCYSKNSWYDTSEGGLIGEYREGIHPQQRWWRSDNTEDPHGVVDDVLKMWGAERIRANNMTRMVFFWLTFEKPFQRCRLLQTKRPTYKGHYKNHVKVIEL